MALDGYIAIFQSIGSPSHSTFWTPSTNNVFALIKKFFLQTLDEIILDIIKFLFRVPGPPGTPYDFFFSYVVFKIV